MASQSPPHNLEAERSILGGAFLDSSVIHRVDIQPADFYLAAHQSLWRVILRLGREGVPADFVTVKSILADTGEFDGLGGLDAYLGELIDYVPTASNVGFYVDIVKGKAQIRRIFQAAKEIGALTFDQELNPGEIAAQSLALIEQATASEGGQQDVINLTTAADLYEQHVKKLSRSRFVTGWPDLDGIIRGVAPGEVLILCAYSGLFKSAILQNMLLNGCQRTGEHHLFFSIEMPTARVFERTAQIGLEQLTYNIESGFHNRVGFKEQTLAELQRVGADKLLICDKPQPTIEQIEYITRQARARYGGIGAIGIDYLGLMGATGKEKEYDRISFVAENSKHLAKRLNLPVIILTQIDRTSAREGKVEKFSAKGSGAIEASADYMIGLEKDDQKRLILKLLKNRNGEENLKFLVDIEAKYLKVRGVSAYDEIAAKNVTRGKGRLRRDLDDDPRSFDPFS